MATAKIKAGMADCLIAGGVESMSLLPMSGWRTVLNYDMAKSNPDYYSSMGLTAEAIAKQFNISRAAQDEFSYTSHVRALKAIADGTFKSGIAPIEVEEVYLEGNKRKTRKYIVDTDEGPRAETTVEALAKLPAVFAQGGSVTAGNSSQTSDGAAFVLLMSEKMVKELNLEPIGRMMSCTTVGVEPRIMGIGPVAAIPKALKLAGLSLNDIQQIELNEAFAAQSLAVIQEAGLNPEIINPNGGAIALGHPLACTGAKLTVQLMNEMKARNQKYGMVSACIGGGQGIASVFERF
jgi:acetyl-CoA acyltransferase